jgi:hypothetical protein
MPTSRIFFIHEKKEILKNTKPIRLFQDNCEENTSGTFFKYYKLSKEDFGIKEYFTTMYSLY